MGWKNIKEGYRIGHSVCLTEEGFCIGSPYVYDLIVIGLDGAIKKRCDDRINDDLHRYQNDMDADPERLRRLINEPDEFKAALPVFTYDGGTIIEKQCEEYGWPNVTHDGQIMYNNSFSADKAEVVKWAKENCGYAIKLFEERLLEIKQRLSKMEQLLSEEKDNLTNLETNYPL